ncbi:hypothetical protein LPU83_pLPU83c_0779 (plasmid) [Rhizobium favelukesii]|uniref:Uncharacterized protein n=1 Tax=Rhizobium favelukesii TaxID=348824 RepID=W6S4Y0_9HYPH|nr:hypothetical protein LPU83_pLPU83c_0779 [Rhizobium favelukesii]
MIGAGDLICLLQRIDPAEEAAKPTVPSSPHSSDGADAKNT